jgi:hypothetical protein
MAGLINNIEGVCEMIRNKIEEKKGERGYTDRGDDSYCGEDKNV